MCLFTLLLSQEIGWSVFLYCSSWSLLKSVEIVKIKDYNYFFSLFIVTPDWGFLLLIDCHITYNMLLFCKKNNKFRPGITQDNMMGIYWQVIIGKYQNVPVNYGYRAAYSNNLYALYLRYTDVHNRV